MYGSMQRGLRQYYERFPSSRATAGFRASMILAFTCNIVLASVAIIGDYTLTGNIHWIAGIASKKWLLLLIGVVVACAHVPLDRVGSRVVVPAAAVNSKWRMQFVAYTIVASVLLATAMFIIFTVGPG